MSFLRRLELEAWSLRLGACSLGRGPPLLQSQVVPGSLCSEPGVPGYTHSFSSIILAISLNSSTGSCSVSFHCLALVKQIFLICLNFFLSLFISFFICFSFLIPDPTGDVQLLHNLHQLDQGSGPPDLQGRGQYYFNLIPDPLLLVHET